MNITSQPQQSGGEISDGTVVRRRFLRQAGGVLLAGSASLSARSYARVVGANDRIRLAQLG